MIPQSVEIYTDIFTKKSMILNQPNKKDDGKNRPRFSNPICDLNMLRRYHRKLLDNATSDKGHADLHFDILGEPVRVGLLPESRRQLRLALKKFERYNSAQPKNAQTEKPTGHFLDEINKCKARVAVYEMESRAIIKILEVENMKQSTEEIHSQISMLNVKRRGLLAALRNENLGAAKRTEFENKLIDVRNEIKSNEKKLKAA